MVFNLNEVDVFDETSWLKLIHRYIAFQSTDSFLHVYIDEQCVDKIKQDVKISYFEKHTEPEIEDISILY